MRACVRWVVVSVGRRARDIQSLGHRGVDLKYTRLLAGDTQRRRYTYRGTVRDELSQCRLQCERTKHTERAREFVVNTQTLARQLLGHTNKPRSPQRWRWGTAFGNPCPGESAWTVQTSAPLKCTRTHREEAACLRTQIDMRKCPSLLTLTSVIHV
jgi:hypothetical protein